MALLDNYHRMKNAVDVGVDDFFAGSPVTVGQDKKVSRTRGGHLAYVMRNIGVFVLVSCLAGALMSVWPVMALSGTAQVVEPAAEYWKSLPENLDDIEIGQRNTLYDINGNKFAEVWSENRTTLTDLNQISDYAKNGLIATEDKDFFKHKGFSLRGTARAALSSSGGGSGITQQLVKNLQFYNLAGREKQGQAVEATVGRKVRELKLAMGYEKHHSKNEILLTYFNTVAFGSPTTYSIETASQYFFGKSAKDLDLAESAVLVGSVQNPARFNLDDPDTFKDKYKARQKDVLSRMVSEGYITQQDADAAYAEELKLVYSKSSNGNCTSSAYPYYCEYVMDFLSKSPRLGETQEERNVILQKGGLHIHTYLDPNAMSIVNAQLQQDYGNDNHLAAPTAVVQPGTGGVLAMGANRDYGTGEGQTTVNLPLHATGSGSVYKMFTLAAALHEGFTENDLAFSSRCPLVDPDYDTPEGGITNSDSCALQGGFMDYRRATALSSNTWFSELEIKVGVEKVKEFSASVGLSAPDTISSRSLAYTLGVTENSTVDMAAAFATFSNGGVFCPATPVSSYTYADGSSPVVPDTYDPKSDSCRRVLSEKDAGTVLKAMRANVSGEIPNAFGNKFNTPGYDTAAKSGTNQLYNSTWAVLSGNFSVFSNLYDPNDFTEGMDPTTYRGGTYRWWDHVIGYTGRDIMTSLLSTEGYKPLKYNSDDDSMTEIPIETRDFVTIPSVIGMQPAQALSTLQATGFPVHLSKEKKSAPSQYPSGVIVEQSVKAGTQLPVGSKKEITIYESK